MKIKWDLRLIISIVIFVAIVGGSILSCYLKGKRQGDFAVYYSAATAFKEGLDPYDTPNLSRALGQAESNPYNYPPDTLYVYLPLTYFSLGTAARIFLSLKLGAVCILLILWNRIFRFKEHLYLLFLVAPLAFNGALLDDLGAGNISVFEQMFIWIGFYYYSRGKIAVFAAAVIVASAFKFVSILLLLLLVTRLRKTDFVCLIVSGVVFALSVAINALVWPHLFAGFVTNMLNLSGADRGDTNPALLIFLNDVTQWMELKSGYVIPGIVTSIIYLMICGATAYAGWLAFSRMRSMDQIKADRWRICLICLLYAMLMPRFKNYSYILIIAPALYAIVSRPLAKAWMPFCVLLVIYTYREFNVLGNAMSPFYQAGAEYYSLFMAWFVGGLFCYSFLTDFSASAGEIDQEPGYRPAPGEKPRLDS